MNEIVAESGSVLKQIATAHDQINSYGFGDPWEMTSSGVTNYPMLFAVLQGGRYLKNERQFNISLLIMDRSDERMDADVISDCELILQDIVAQLNHPDYDFRIAEAVSFDDFSEEFADKVAGVKGDLTFRLKYEYDRCAIPMDAITITNKTSRV